ncbi:MAG: hypothetical protein ACOY82_03815 [Pseudomonadota bacterium]
MTDLVELRQLLQSLADCGGTAKVSFYYVGDDGIGLRTGSILVDRGVRAHVVHAGMPPAQAIEAILGLKLVKVASLQMSSIQPPPGSDAVGLGDLISALGQVVAPTRAAAAATSAASAPAESSRAAQAPTATTEAPALPAIDVKAEALRLMEPLFGIGAVRKIDEFAIAHPPTQHPYEFLLLCQKHTGIMLGGPKAEALFRPLYDQLETERLKRRR